MTIADKIVLLKMMYDNAKACEETVREANPGLADRLHWKADGLYDAITLLQNKEFCNEIAIIYAE